MAAGEDAVSHGLSERERRLVAKLVDATRELENIYWRQNDREGLALLKSLEGKCDRQSQELPKR